MLISLFIPDLVNTASVSTWIQLILHFKEKSREQSKKDVHISRIGIIHVIMTHNSRKPEKRPYIVTGESLR